MEGPTQIGEWQKISDLGSGAFGIVSLWKNNNVEDYIAIKKCKFHTTSNLTIKQKERWNNEVKIMKIINHPNIIKYKSMPIDLELGIHNPTKLPLLPMEYCRKGNLRRVLCKPKNLCGLQEEDVRCILEDICNGLQHLHQLKITHRDIKPDNIVLQHCDNRKGTTIYKIIDLGYAKELSDTVVSFVGTLHYLAPEIFQNGSYNNSVDYWSMGILTFEIICGVIPFLPYLQPFERFDKIKKKGPDDICIYLSYAGQVTYSSEIKKENFISNCLKQSIEIWLRHVLQYDPNKRSQNFPKDVKVFDCLHNILQKKIITVFSVHKLEFYSYEVNDSTLVGTLKDWISRDIKVSKTDLLLLFPEKEIVDDSCLVDHVIKDKRYIFVMKKGGLVSDSVIFSFPKLLRELFNPATKFDNRHIKQLYAQVIYYVITEKTVIEASKESFNLFVVYLQNLILYLKKSYINSSQNLSKLMIKIECYNNVRKNNICDIDLSKNQEYKDCLTYSQRLVASLERSMANFKSLKNKIDNIRRKQHVLRGCILELKKLFDECHIDQLYEKAVTLIESSNGKIFAVDIKNILSETIKIKDKLVHNKKIKSYLSAIASVHNEAEALKTWMAEFNTHIFELSKSFEKSEIVYRNIILKAAENNHKRKSDAAESLNGELLKLPIEYLIRENKELRYKFEDILSKSILAHKNHAEALRSSFLSL